MRSRIKSFLVVPLLFVLAGQIPTHAQSGVATLSVDVTAGRHPITPDIYGIANGVDSSFAKEIQLPNVRWGGDATTRYNWEVDSSNAGFDWYFMGGNGESTPVPGASVDQLISTYAPAHPLITVPIIPYVNKTAAWNCSFPVSVYGNQQSTNPYVHPNGDSCGNSISTSGAQLTDTNIYANHIDNTTGLQQGWIQHLVNAHGTAANGGVPYYQLDNEPGGWSNTHRDVEPTQPAYPVIVQLGQQYAAAVKLVDPSADVFGPSDFTDGGWIGTPSQQGGLLAGQYYLQQMAAYDQQHQQRILDYFDEHYYPAFTNQASQLEVTRTFWDPTYNSGSWVEQWYFNGPMMLIPRFQSWVSQYYPGTKVALSEYSIDSGNKTIVDALAEMDVLGIFGRQQLDFANMWSPPAPTDPIAYGFRIYRNYDGQGSQYGDTWVNAASTNQDQLSIYGSQRTSDGALTILVLNKTTGSISTSLSVSDVTLPPTALVYSYSNANLQQIVQSTDAPIVNGSLTYAYPGYSATLFVIPAASAQPLSTTTTLSASASSIAAGQPLALVATVSSSGSGTPTGTVTFLDGSTTLGTENLVSGKASLSTTTLSAGSHTLTAAYGGDANDSASTSSAVMVKVSSSSSSSSPNYTLTLSTSAVSANEGQSAQLTVIVMPENGFNLPLALTCSGLPAGAICSFNPSTLTPSSAAAKASLTIAISSTSAKTKTKTQMNTGGLGYAYGLFLPLPFMLVLGSSRRRPGMRMSLLLLAVFITMGLLGCGSSANNPSPSTTSGTRPGVYTITITTRGANAPSHQQQVTLTVGA